MNYIILDKNNYLLIIDERMNKELFVSNAKVREGTYAFDLIKRISEVIFSETIDLKKEFETYYSDEYNSFIDFLIKKYHVEAHIAEDISRRIDMKILFGNKLSYGDYGLSSIVFNQDGMYKEKLNDIVNSLLEVNEQ
jgi:hypothetical protein